MKKFELIKAYPKSPFVGCKAYLASDHYEYGSYRFTRDEVENYPEFWRNVDDFLFITHDNVKIYHPSIFFILNTKYGNKYWEQKTSDNINYFTQSDKNFSEKTGIYYFSNKEAVINYLITNSCCISIKEIINILESKASTVAGLSINNELRELVKNKLNIE